jgi:HNH endonuclease
VTRILPSIACLQTAPIERRHAPVSHAAHERGYERFRPCLRWEFSFSCAFCLLHECQVCHGGALSSAQFWIEHLEPQSERSDLRNVYSNVVYACRRCNLSRRARPRGDAQGRRLLDPCRDAWAEHFRAEDDQLRALTPDAGYTAETYDVNGPAKVALRRERREAVDEALHVLATVPALLEQLMAGIGFRPGHEQRLRLEVAEQLHKALAAARRTLLQLSAIPEDASNDCACDRDACRLTEPMIAGLLQVELEPGRQ